MLAYPSLYRDRIVNYVLQNNNRSMQNRNPSFVDFDRFREEAHTALNGNITYRQVMDLVWNMRETVVYFNARIERHRQHQRRLCRVQENSDANGEDSSPGSGGSSNSSASALEQVFSPQDERDIEEMFNWYLGRDENQYDSIVPNAQRTSLYTALNAMLRYAEDRRDNSMFQNIANNMKEIHAKFAYHNFCVQLNDSKNDQ